MAFRTIGSFVAPTFWRPIWQFGFAALCLTGLGNATALAQDARGESQHVIFLSQRGGAAELYLLDLNSRQVSQLTNTGRGHTAPSLARAGRGVVFAAREGSHYELFAASISQAWRSRRPQLVGMQRLTINTVDEVSPSVSADGSFIAFASGDGIEFMTAGGGARQVLVPASDATREYCPAISPDGNQVAFISNRENGRTNTDEVWVLERATGALRQLTRDAQPVGGLSWSADGQKLAFTTTNTVTKLTGVAIVELANGLATGAYRVVSEQGDSNPSLSARGDRLLMTSWRDGDAELYLLNLNDGQTTRLTFSAGLDDGAVFVPTNSGMPTRLP